jgi:putative ABC transport system permease protein
MVSQSYAKSHTVKLGGTMTLGGKNFTVVGIVTAPLSGQTTDVYVPLNDLQTISKRTGRSNVVVVRTTNASKVASVSSSIKKQLPGAQVANAADLAKQVNGSLVDSANVAHRLGLVLAIVALVAAFGLATLLTLGGVAKRVRELGTLKAIGWRPGLVVRQVIGESAVVGVLGGILGAILGIGAASLLGAFSPKLSAQSVQATGNGQFGFGFFARRFGDSAQAASSVVHLKAPVHPSMVLIAIGLAILGGLIAGAIGAMRAARLRPADAMRDVG